MNNLELLLSNGAPGVTQDAPAAVEVLRRAVGHHGHVGSINSLTILLYNGGTGVKKELRIQSICSDEPLRTMMTCTT